VEHVFELSGELPDNVKHLLVVDDVVTTGSTVIACARQLAKIDGIRISVMSLGLTKR
jgi:predicted amidophosphoribosyltransferase